MAANYGGQYDPDYVYSASGAIFATTFEGLQVMRDGCSFTSSPLGNTFVTQVEQTPAALFVSASTSIDAKIYKSTDDGMSFPTAGNPGAGGDWWSSVAVAPSNPDRIYISGYRLDGQNPKIFLMYTSTDAGSTYAPMSMTGITPVSANSTIEIVGVHPTNDQTVFAKVTFENGASGDSIYKSTNAGQSWTKLLSKNSNFGLSFLARKVGTATTCIAGTRDMGSWVSTNCDTNWTPLTNAPHIGCLYQDSAGVVWACTQNYASPQLNLPSDGFGIMKTTDLMTWVGMLKFQDIQAPVSCPAGTVQEDRCVQKYMDQQSQWCCLVPQLGITSTAIDCTGALACFGNPLVDGAPDGGTTINPPKDPDSCCGTGNGRSSVMLSLLVAVGLLFRRRRPS